MALQSDTNVVNVTGAGEALYRLKLVLVAAGWDIIMSGGGTGSGLYSAVGDVIASAAIMGTSRAWFRARAPAAMNPRREFTFQIGSGGITRNVWIKYSAEDGFIGGAPDEDDMPTATDEQNVWGTAVAGTALFAVAGTYRQQIVADDAAPYGWWLTCTITGVGTPTAELIFEPLQPGTYPSVAPNEDPDPALVFCYSGNGWLAAVIGAVGTAPYGWFQKNAGTEAFARMPAYRLVDVGGNILAPGGEGTNPETGYDAGERILFARAAGLATQVGRKGYGANIRWNAVARANCDTQSDPATGDIARIVFGDITLPYPNVVPLV